MAKYILALDSGTTSTRAILFGHEGEIVGISQREFSQIFPAPGWVEHNPEVIWESQFGVATELFRKTGIGPEEVSGIGITNQRETTLIWDRQTGMPVYNAIVWQDRRTAAYCNELIRQGLEGLVKAKTGLVIDAYFSASKIRWILDHVKDAGEKAEQGKLAFGTIDTWLVWKLTGGKIHVTDVSNASRTMLYNIHQLEWDKDLLEITGIPESMLPEVRSSSEVYGKTSHDLFGAEIPVAGIAGDQQAALFGQACMEKGMAKNTYGTGCFVVMNTGTEAISSGNKLLTTIAWKIGGQVNYALEGSIFIGGTVVQWLRDNLKIISSSDQVEELAGRVDNNGGVYFVPAFVGLGAPHWDSSATGTIIGINRDTTDAHIARAALEAIALRTLEVIRTMEQDSGITLKALRVDGGASVNNLLMQIQANLLQANVIRPAITETTALGAAYLAGLATGFWDGIEEIKTLWKEVRIFIPLADKGDISRLIDNWALALNRSRNWNPAD